MTADTSYKPQLEEHLIGTLNYFVSDFGQLSHSQDWMDDLYRDLLGWTDERIWRRLHDDGVELDKINGAREWLDLPPLTEEDVNTDDA